MCVSPLQQVFYGLFFQPPSGYAYQKIKGKSRSSSLHQTLSSQVFLWAPENSALYLLFQPDMSLLIAFCIKHSLFSQLPCLLEL